MPQVQFSVLLRSLDGKERRAVATGNNAAWLCTCGRQLPLIGVGAEVKGIPEAFQVHCPDCPRVYFVVADSIAKTKVVEVRELEVARPVAY
jgi:hypothetical protein